MTHATPPPLPGSSGSASSPSPLPVLTITRGPGPKATPPPLPDGAAVPSIGLTGFDDPAGSSVPPPAPENHKRFKPNGVALACWLGASTLCAALGGAGGNALPQLGAFAVSTLGSMLALGVLSGLVAVGLRRLGGMSNRAANVAFAVGVFAWAILSVAGQMTMRQRADAATTPPAKTIGASDTLADARAAASTRPAATQPTVSPAVAALHQQARDERARFLTATNYPKHKPMAGYAVLMLNEGKPWRWIDQRVATPLKSSPSFKSAYRAWRTAELRAGHNPKVAPDVLVALTRLQEIRNAVAQYKTGHNNRLPTLRQLVKLPVNPFTGQSAVAAPGAADATKHGWTYDAANGTVRMVLPPARTYAGLTPAEFEHAK